MNNNKDEIVINKNTLIEELYIYAVDFMEKEGLMSEEAYDRVVDYITSKFDYSNRTLSAAKIEIRRIIKNVCNKQNNDKNPDFVPFSEVYYYQMYSYNKDYIYKIIESMNEDYKKVLIMYYFDNYTIKEIAEELGISIYKTRDNLRRAVFFIRRMFRFKNHADDFKREPLV